MTSARKRRWANSQEFVEHRQIGELLDLGLIPAQSSGRCGTWSCKPVRTCLSRRTAINRSNVFSHAALAVFALAATAPRIAQAQEATAPAAYVGAAEITAQIEKMRRSLKPGQTFAYQPIVRAGDASAAIEYWRAPGKPAVHPDQAEYVVVLAGSGTMISGGKMIDAETTNPSLIEGTRIVGGTTRQLRPGDVFLIAAGTPHWFGVTGTRLVLLGTKIPQPMAHAR